MESEKKSEKLKPVNNRYAVRLASTGAASGGCVARVGKTNNLKDNIRWW